jgi:hypothetical protein
LEKSDFSLVWRFPLSGTRFSWFEQSVSQEGQVIESKVKEIRFFGKISHWYGDFRFPALVFLGLSKASRKRAKLSNQKSKKSDFLEKDFSLVWRFPLSGTRFSWFEQSVSQEGQVIESKVKEIRFFGKGFLTGMEISAFRHSFFLV